MVEVRCDTCGVSFQKKSYEVQRSVKRNANHYCSKHCFGKRSQNLNRLHSLSKLHRPNISAFASNKKDEYTGLRSLFRAANTRAKDRVKPLEFDLTLESLLEIWIKQKGRCIYSGVELKLPGYKGQNSKIYTASIDRINANKGYTQDNIQFISIAMNLAKNSMTHDEMLELCKIIREGQSSGVTTRFENG